MKYLSFQNRLDKVLNEYINPNEIYDYHYGSRDKISDNRVTFIYNPDGIIFYGDEKNSTHADIISLNIQYYLQNYIDEDNADIYDDDGEYDIYFFREEIECVSLLGRCGTMDDSHYVTFWNVDEELYETMLEPCLQQLLNDGNITQDTLLSIPHMALTRIGDTRKQIGTKLDVEQLAKIELMRQLHLMKPEQKKAAMLKLGLNPNSSKHAWQKESEKAGLIQPGQKWWATTSESFIK